MDLRIVAMTAMTPALWGTTYVVTTEMLPPDRPLLASVLRALPVGLIFIAWSRQLPEGRWWWRTAVLGALNIGAFFALLFVAAYRLPGGVAATAGAMQPLVAAGLAALLLNERFSTRTGVAGVVGVVGVALLVLQPGAGLDPVGVVAALLGTLSMATGIVLTKRWGRPVGLVAFTGWQLVAGGLLLAPTMLLLEGLPAPMTAMNVGGFAWLGLVGTGFAYSNWFHGIQRLPVSVVSFLGLLSPVVATLIGWSVRGEALAPGQLVGGALVLSAVVTAATAARRPARRRPDDAIGLCLPPDPAR